MKGSGFGCGGVSGGGGVGWLWRNAAPGARRTKTITEGKASAVAWCLWLVGGQGLKGHDYNNICRSAVRPVSQLLSLV